MLLINAKIAMDIINIFAITALYAVCVVSRCNSSPDDDPEPRCISSCYGVCDGRYHACHRGCEHFIICDDQQETYQMCSRNRQWDDNKKQCVRYSNTCAKMQPRGPELFMTSLRGTTDITEAQETQCSLSDVLQEIIPIIVAFCAALIFICVSCLIWKQHCCRRDNKQNMQTASTQTVVNCYSTYEELQPYFRTENESSGRYFPMPYAISGDVDNQQNVGSSPYNFLVHEGNPYLELHGYAYLQLQDDITRDKVNQAMSPLIVALCNEVKEGSDKFQDLKEKLGKVVEEVAKKDTTKDVPYEPLKNDYV